MVLSSIFLQNALSLDGVSSANRTLLEAVVEQINAANDNYKALREYWDGDHPVRLTDRLKQFLRLSKIKDAKFADNFCGVVISAATDRLSVQGFTVPGEASTDNEPGPVAQFANDVWTANRCDAMQKDVYGDALALGDAYVIVEWDEVLGRPRLSFNPAEMIRMDYDPSNYQTALRASKRWVLTTGPIAGVGAVRLNLYYPDRIERYISNSTQGGGNWQQFKDNPDDDWPVPWLMPDGEPIGIPVLHFRNSPRGGNYGRSDLADVIDIQDTLNKALVDGIKVMDAQGWPQRWSTGIDVVPSADLLANPGSVWHAAAKEARFGAFDMADPEKLVAWMEHITATIASISQTPQHIFKITGGAPSGEALKTAEAPLVRKVMDRQTRFGNAWEDVMRIAANVSTAHGRVVTIPTTGITVEWEDAETRPSEKERIEAINLKEGISARQRLREYGYTNEEIERIITEKKDEPNDIADALAAAFDRGDGTGQGAIGGSPGRPAPPAPGG